MVAAAGRLERYRRVWQLRPNASLDLGELCVGGAVAFGAMQASERVQDAANRAGAMMG